MKLDSIIAGLIALALATAAVAQHRGSGSGTGSDGHASALAAGSPAGSYAGFDKRQVAAFTDDDVTGLLAGRGMGFALPAELNGWPGPMHILEFAEPLRLTPDQRSQIKAIFDRMQARAREAGARYVEAEKALDSQFRSPQADREAVRRLAIEADRLRAEKRLAHLEAHIEAAPILTPEQRTEYGRLRGYAQR